MSNTKAPFVQARPTRRSWVRPFATRAQKLIIPLILGLVGLLPFLTKDGFVGNNQDSRFNMYVLEHGYASIFNRNVSFWNAPFFYPEKSVTAYGDNLLGNLPLYAVFRWSGCDREQAFQNWTLAALALTYISGYAALRCLGASPFAAALGAYYFAYGLPIHGQVSRVQLLPRYFVPWAFVFSGKWLLKGGAGNLALAAASLVAQFYVGTYTGLLAGITIGAHLLALLGLGNRREISRNLFSSCRNVLAQVVVCGLAAVALLPVVRPYLEASHEIGIRSWNEIMSMLPRLNSWICPPPTSICWNWMNGVPLFGFEDLPMIGEHRNFVGIIMFSALLLWPFLRNFRHSLSLWASCAWLTLLICITISLFVWTDSIWHLLLSVPGIGAMRAVTRIVLPLLFPMAVILAATITLFMDYVRLRLSTSPRAEAKTAAVGFLIALALIADNSVSSVEKCSFAESRKIPNEIKAALKEIKPSKGTCFWVCQNQPSISRLVTDVSAMLASQDLGIPTINGYSGWYPLNFDLSPSDEPMPATFLLKTWLHTHGMGESTNVLVLNNAGLVSWKDAPAAQYTLGSPIRFVPGQCEPYLERGFSYLGSLGFCTVAQSAFMNLKLSETPHRNLQLNLTGQTLPGYDFNSIQVRINGVEVASCVTQGHNNQFGGSYPFSEQIARSKGGTLEIEFWVNKLRLLSECFPQITNRQQVGIFLSSLSIE